MQVDLGESGDDEVQDPGLVEALDVLLEAELVDDFARRRREPADVGPLFYGCDDEETPDDERRYRARRGKDRGRLLGRASDRATVSKAETTPSDA